MPGVEGYLPPSEVALSKPPVLFERERWGRRLAENNHWARQTFSQSRLRREWKGGQVRFTAEGREARPVGAPPPAKSLARPSGTKPPLYPDWSCCSESRLWGDTPSRYVRTYARVANGLAFFFCPGSHYTAFRVECYFPSSKKPRQYSCFLRQ